MKKTKTGRRQFLAAAAAAPMILPAAVPQASDRLAMGLIGAGGRGRNVTAAFVELGAQFGAVCDVYEPNLARGLEAAGAAAKPYTDYRRVLERKDLNAVLIATPDHWHVPMILDAVSAGFDVYCEKPMSHSISEGVRCVRGVRATDRIVQIGMQRRSTPWIIEAKQKVDDGVIGKVMMAKAQWNWIRSRPLDNSPLEGKLDWKMFSGPAPYRDLEPMRFRRWRNFWEFSGGNMTDQGTHLMDVIQWLSNSGTPRSAVCQGKVYAMQGAAAPDVFAAAFEYQDMLATWDLNYNNDYEDGWTIRLEGTGGTMILNGNGIRIFKAPWTENQMPFFEQEDTLPTIPHVRNFMECVKSRQEPNAPVEVGHSAVCGPHLANVAFHTRRAAYLNPEATEAY
ncbi:MAG: Gfo/Idh/MocA family oxidoreductase [Bryobacterales bacterium]